MGNRFQGIFRFQVSGSVRVSADVIDFGPVFLKPETRHLTSQPDLTPDPWSLLSSLPEPRTQNPEPRTCNTLQSSSLRRTDVRLDPQPSQALLSNVLRNRQSFGWHGRERRYASALVTATVP